MTDIPIIFSAPMVRALLGGRKTMTRRLAWRDAKFGLQDFASEQIEDMELRGWNVVKEGGLYRVFKPTSWQKVKPGDRLWVRENFASKCGDLDHPECFRYSATYDGMAGVTKWTPSIHMPRKASRITLDVAFMKFERLQDISEDDAQAEGIICYDATEIDDAEYSYEFGGPVYASAKSAFRGLWTKLHGAESWDENPDVVAPSFEVIAKNIGSI